MERNQETTYEYDKLGRITSATDEIGTISYTYDGCGNVLTVSETDNDGNTQTIRRTYDCMNRVSSYTDYKGNTVKYGYDELGNLISLTYAGGEIVRYKYYDNGALKEVIDTENLVTSYTYDKRGNLLTTQNPDGTTEVNTYDDLGQLATRTLYKAAAGESNRSNPSDSQDNTSGYGEVVYSYTYTYDDWGNITGISYTDNLSDKDKESDGLISDAQKETELLKSSTMTYDSSNRMITYNGEKIEYDSDGNMTYGPLNGKMVCYEYDCRNRLIRAGDTDYTYDAENIRTATITPEYTEEYITDSVSALSRVLEIDRTYQSGYIQDNEDNAGKSTEHEIYYYGNGLAYEKWYDSSDGYINSIGDSNVYVYHYDHLGSTKLVTDIDGKEICRFDYGTYGELLTTEYDKTIRYLYNGQLGVITDDNGLYYMRSRYYNPEIKRFINQDILTGNIGNSASLNRYSYVEGNPVSYTDPFGLSPFRTVHDVFHALYYIPVIGHGIAAVDSLIYLAEGEYTKAGVSAIYAIPGGTGVGFAIEATAGATAFFLPDDMVKNHDNPIIQDLYEYSHYDEMSKGQIALYTIINGISAYGELKVFNTEPVYEGDYIDFKDPEVRKRFNNNGVKDSGFVNAGGSGNRFSPDSYYSYGELKNQIKESGLSGRGIGFEAHHLLEKQYAGKFGVAQDDIISVALTGKWHRGVNGEKIIGEGININARIEAELMDIVGTNSRAFANRIATPENIWQAHKAVYESIGRYDWANAIYEAYVKPMGITY